MNDLFDDQLPTSGIAVLGMACRVPGADSLDELWRSLCAGREGITRFSKEELLAAGNDPALIEHPDYVPLNRVVSGVDRFDAGFFGFTPREAELLDPQQRFFLECAHEALEVAGYGARERRGPTGVFAGVTVSSYLLNNLLPNAELLKKLGAYHLFLHNEKDFLPTRASYKLDLRGPSVNVQTACSTSLVAIHMACQALLEGACDLALAGGASIRVPQEAGYLYQRDMIFSPDGRACAFDAGARGAVAGSGVGVVVLKRLDAAIDDRDTILAVIRGSAINNDGAAKIGFTAPSVEGQARVIREALAVAGVGADSISYVEAHGTATPLGDPIEVAALTRAFGGAQAPARPRACALGALKNNLGHMDAAAGVGGLIKTALMLQRRMIPPSSAFKAPNPQIDLASGPFYVNTELEPWRSDGAPRRAGVSSFGIGGTNAHVILEEAPAAPPSEPGQTFQLLTLSAKTESALERACTGLAEHLEKNDAQSLADVAFTLHVGREPLALRRAVVCQGRADALIALRGASATPPLTDATTARPIVLMFPGGGSQYPQMGRELYEAYGAFREVFDGCAAILRRSADLDLTALLFEGAEAGEHAARMRRPLCGLVSLFAVEYALAKLLLSWGIQPQAMIGHSMGEYVAACLAGVFSLEDALLVVARRGQLFETLPAGGALLSVPLPEGELRPLLSGALAIAAVNTPSTCAVAGTAAEIDALAARLEPQGVACRRVHIDVAAHSPSVDPILGAFQRLLQTIKLAPPQIPVLSNLTGARMTDAQATSPAYWAQHLRQPVRFADGLKALLEEPKNILLEVGPGTTLSTFARQHPAYRGQAALSTLRHPLMREPDAALLLKAVGALWSCGGHVDWTGFHAGERRRRVPLPTYPFERQRFWIDPPAPGERGAPSPPEARPRADVADWFYVPSWKLSLLGASEAPERLQILLLVSDEAPLHGLAADLRRQGHGVTVARLKGGSAGVGAEDLTLDPRRPEDYVAVCEASAERAGGAPDLIVHALSVGQPGGASAMTPASIEAAQALGLHSLVLLTRALDRLGFVGKTRVTALTSGVHRVTGGEALRPEKATLLAWLKTAPLEHPGLTCRIVEVAAPARPGELDALSVQLCAELVVGGGEPLVAYRGRQRWTPTYEAIRLPAAEPIGPSSALREGGVYLITGGLGEVGLSLATALAQRAPVKLVLLGRAALPPRSEWGRYLGEDEGADAELCRKIRGVVELERLGAEVMTVAADVCSRPSMEASIAEARARFGAINGVIHAAGAPGGGVMLRLSPASLARTLGPKLEGTLVLASIFAGAPLDFMMLCSALVTLVGAFGSLDYTAANAFLDAFAHASSGENGANGARVVSINWYRWKGLGMAKAVEAMHAAVTGEALGGMEEEQGRDAFLRILDSRALRLAGAPQVVVSSEALEPLLHAQPDLPGARSAQPVASPAQRAPHGRPALSTAYVPASTPTAQRLLALFEGLLGVEGLGVDDSFFELGGDSLVGTRLMAHAREAFRTDLSLRDLFEAPTVAGLAQRIDAAAVLRVIGGAPPPSPEDHDDLEVGSL